METHDDRKKSLYTVFLFYQSISFLNHFIPYRKSNHYILHMHIQMYIYIQLIYSKYLVKTC